MKLGIEERNIRKREESKEKVPLVPLYQVTSDEFVVDGLGYIRMFDNYR